MADDKAPPERDGANDFVIKSSKATFRFEDGTRPVHIDLIEADEEITKLIRKFREKSAEQDYYEAVVRPFAKWVADSNDGELLGLSNAHSIICEIQRVVAKKGREHVEAIG